MSGTSILEPGHDYACGTTDWKFQRWDANQATWARRRMERALPERLLREPVQRDFYMLGVKPYSVTEHHGNVITNAGWQALLASATTGGTPMFTACKGRLGIGDTAGTPAAVDTDLAATSGSTHRLFKFMAAAPTVGTGHEPDVDVRRHLRRLATSTRRGTSSASTSGTTDGTTVAAPLLNHANSAQGTKTSGQVWTATAVLSFTLWFGLYVRIAHSLFKFVTALTAIAVGSQAA